MSTRLKANAKAQSSPKPSFAGLWSGRLQRSSTDHARAATVPPIVHEVLRSPGQPLDSATREFMEPRFGHDFSRVRVHTDAKAAESARVIGARAYTAGQDVVFGKGEYAAGKSLLAHELTHVVQQRRGGGNSLQSQLRFGSADDSLENEADRIASKVVENHSEVTADITPVSLSVQRACGPAAIGNVGGCTGRGGDITDFGGSSDRLILFDVNCDEFLPGEVSKLRRLARTILPTDVVEIDGFASEEGNPQFNDNLSCARAHAAESELLQQSVATTITLFRHGATPGFRDDRRSAVISLIPSVPSTSTPAPQHICGPDVTTQVEDAVSNTKSTFNTIWGTMEKENACQALISLTTGGFAWDIVDLHNNAWILGYRPACATRGARPPCGSTVQVGRECSYAGSPNYVVYGVMMRLCNSYYENAGRTDDANDFTRGEMLDWINFYKGTGPLGIGTPSGNFIPSQNWAEAGYDGWPAATTPSGDRNNCHPSCGTAYSGSAFRVHWHPHGIF